MLQDGIDSVPLPYMADGEQYFLAVADLPWAAWLDSAGRGRYDIICAQPYCTLVMHGDRTQIWQASGESHDCGSDPFELVRNQLGERSEPTNNLPFAGGALGYWGYDMARRLGLLPAVAVRQDDQAVPDMAIGIYDWAIVIDHQERTARLVSRLRNRASKKTLQDILARLTRGRSNVQGRFSVHGQINQECSWTTYQDALGAIHRYLRAGDCYQVNLAQRFTASACGSAVDAYLASRKISPAPYSAFLKFPEVQILSASPERFLSVRGREIETRPIKGTRPRHSDAGKDKQIADELLRNSKDRAENLMIVDLLRNDLGKSCVPGSVKVPKLFELESYAQVHHLVSTVTGRLQDGQDAISLLKNCFPGGSITGAPKRRAMEIIEELEPGPRGVYCGAIGYIGFDGNMDTNIAIRTLCYANGRIRFWAGSGIVADSDAVSEYQETQDKAAAMIELLKRFGGNYDD